MTLNQSIASSRASGARSASPTPHEPRRPKNDPYYKPGWGEITPGPTDYEQWGGHKVPLAPQNIQSFPRAPTRLSTRSISPGPGNYSWDRSSLSRSGVSKFPTAGGSDQRSHTPGPGMYDTWPRTASRTSLRGYTIPTSLRPIDKPPRAITPAPDAYLSEKKAEIARNNSFRASFGTSRRWENAEKPEHNTPGPGSYNSAPVLKHSSQLAFSNTKRKHISEEAGETPGPGEYNAERPHAPRVGGTVKHNYTIPVAPRVIFSEKSEPRRTQVLQKEWTSTFGKAATQWMV